MTLKAQYDAAAVDENSTSVDAQTCGISSEHQTTEVVVEPVAVDNDGQILQSILNDGRYDISPEDRRALESEMESYSVLDSSNEDLDSTTVMNRKDTDQ